MQIGPFDTLPGIADWLGEQPNPTAIITAALIEYRCNHRYPDTKEINGVLFRKDTHGSWVHTARPGAAVLIDTCGMYQPMINGECMDRNFASAADAVEYLGEE